MGARQGIRGLGQVWKEGMGWKISGLLESRSSDMAIVALQRKLASRYMSEQQTNMITSGRRRRLVCRGFEVCTVGSQD